MNDIYSRAYEDNVFFVEYAGMPAAAGDLRDIVYLAEHADPPRDPAEMIGDLTADFMGAIVDLCVLGKKLDTREAMCESAWEAFREKRDAGHFPRVAAIREELGLPVTDTKPLGTF